MHRSRQCVSPFVLGPRRVRCDGLHQFPACAALAGSFGSSGSLWATPVWQSMHVALPAANFLCCLTASSDCFLLSIACGLWHVRQFAELSARISSQTML